MINEREFELLSGYIRSHFGIHLKPEKKTLLAGRLRQVLEKRAMPTFDQYCKWLLSDRSGAAAAELIDHISTNHTFFMREQAHFEFLSQQALPYWIGQAAADKDLRIWSAGCSSGEEPYGLAMLVHEALGAEAAQWDYRILATDISAKALQRAVQGVYGHDNIAQLPERWIQRYMQRRDDGAWQVNREIREQVLYRRFNLMDAFPFRHKFHIIFCRNVMIYFDPATRMELVRKFYEATERGGYLIIGHSEALDRGSSPYRYLFPSVYLKV